MNFKSGDKVIFVNNQGTRHYPYIARQTVDPGNLFSTVMPQIQSVEIDLNKTYTIKEVCEDGIELEGFNGPYFGPHEFKLSKKHFFDEEIKKIIE